MPSSKPLYGILSVYLPLSILILWSNLFGALLASFVPRRLPFYPFDERLWSLAGFLSAFAASSYAALMKKSNAGHKAADIRGSIIVSLAAYAFLSLFRPGLPLTQRFLPCTDSIAATLAALFAWFMALSLAEIFKDVELFESFTAAHRGERLREIMREYAPEMSRTDKMLRNLMRNYGLGFIPPCILLGAAGFSRHSPLLSLLVFLIFCAGFLLFGFLRLLRRELSFASEGISLTIRDRAMPIPLMALGIGIAALLALAASADKSLLPPEIILKFLAWLGSLLASLFRPADPAALTFMERSPMSMEGDLAGLFPEAEETAPWEGWKWVKYGFIALLAVLFLYFMVHPLLKRSGFYISAGKIYAAVRRWLGDLKRGFSGFFSALRDRGASQKYRPDKEKLRRIASELLSGGVKRKEVKRSVNLFARLILWGIESAGIAWKPSHPPGEYCGLLATAPANRSVDDKETGRKILRCGELFEKALYSPRPLSTAEEREFKRLVEDVIGG